MAVGSYIAALTQATDNIPTYMKECVTARDKLSKFMDKLDTEDPTVKLPFHCKQDSFCEVVDPCLDSLHSSIQGRCPR